MKIAEYKTEHWTFNAYDQRPGYSIVSTFHKDKVDQVQTSEQYGDQIGLDNAWEEIQIRCEKGPSADHIKWLKSQKGEN